MSDMEIIPPNPEILAIIKLYLQKRELLTDAEVGVFTRILAYLSDPIVRIIRHER